MSVIKSNLTHLYSHLVPESGFKLKSCQKRPCFLILKTKTYSDSRIIMVQVIDILINSMIRIINNICPDGSKITSYPVSS